MNNAFVIGSRNISLIGAENCTGACQKLDGQIAELLIFGSALSALEI